MILARTFSKTFSPGFKTGFGILPEALLVPVLALKGNQDFGSANFTQQLLERLLADGSYEAARRGLTRSIAASETCSWRHSRTSWTDRPGVHWTRPREGCSSG